MPNLLTSASLVERATKCFATCRLVAELGQQPVAGGVGVGHRLLGGEGLRGDDEQRPLRVEPASASAPCACRRRWRRNARGRPLGGVGRERRADHERPEVGAADADIDDVGDRACRCTRATRRCGPPRRRSPMRASTPFTSGITSLPSTTIGRPERLRRATWSTARSSVVLIFCPSNIIARQFSTSAWRASSSNRRSTSRVDQVLAVVEQQILEPQREALEAARVAGEGGAQAHAAQALGLGGQRLPGRRGGERGHGGLRNGVTPYSCAGAGATQA